MDKVISKAIGALLGLFAAYLAEGLLKALGVPPKVARVGGAVAGALVA